MSLIKCFKKYIWNGGWKILDYENKSSTSILCLSQSVQLFEDPSYSTILKVKFHFVQIFFLTRHFDLIFNKRVLDYKSFRSDNLIILLPSASQPCSPSESRRRAAIPTVSSQGSRNVWEFASSQVRRVTRSSEIRSTPASASQASWETTGQGEILRRKIGRKKRDLSRKYIAAGKCLFMLLKFFWKKL